MFCWHRYGEVKDKYQYCVKCGLAKPVKPPIPARLPTEPPCVHQWEKDCEIESRIHGGGIGYMLRCTKCGDMKNFRISDR